MKRVVGAVLLLGVILVYSLMSEAAVINHCNEAIESLEMAESFIDSGDYTSAGYRLKAFKRVSQAYSKTFEIAAGDEWGVKIKMLTGEIFESFEKKNYSSCSDSISQLSRELMLLREECTTKLLNVF